MFESRAGGESTSGLPPSTPAGTRRGVLTMLRALKTSSRMLLSVEGRVVEYVLLILVQLLELVPPPPDGFLVSQGRMPWDPILAYARRRVAGRCRGSASGRRSETPDPSRSPLPEPAQVSTGPTMPSSTVGKRPSAMTLAAAQKRTDHSPVLVVSLRLPRRHVAPFTMVVHHQSDSIRQAVGVRGIATRRATVVFPAPGGPVMMTSGAATMWRSTASARRPRSPSS